MRAPPVYGKEGAMRNCSTTSRIPVVLALILLAASNLACFAGWDLLDTEPRDVLDDYERQDAPESTDSGPQGPGQTQGEFVPPAGPQQQPVAPPADAPSAGSASSAPVITDIDFPSTIPADGTTYFGWISFTDADGDVNRIQLHVVHSTTPMSDAENPPGTLEGTASAGKYRMGFYCTIPSLHTMQVTLLDTAGNRSNSMDFSWECR